MAMNLKQAKKHLRDNFAKGTNCPCCGQYVKLYKRKINNGLALFLIELYKSTKTPGQYLHIKQFIDKKKFMGMTHYSTLSYWGLIEKMPNEKDTSKKHSGLWRLTDDGILFVKARLTVPKFIYSFNGEVVGFDDKEKVDIYDCLDSKFDYSELMGLSQ